MGLLFAAFLLAAGLVLTLGLVAWSLVRGKKPRVVRFGTRDPFAGMRRHGPAPRGEVVDIEAREVPDLKATLRHE